MKVYHCKTVAGVCLIHYDEVGVNKFDLPSHDLEDGNNYKNEKLVDANVMNLSDLLVKYFEGVKVDFQEIKLSLRTLSPFSRIICEVVQSVPYGHVMSYSDVAVKAGKPRAARAVGRVMATNPLPILIPCHRVVSSNGLMTGYSAEGGVKRKKMLLKMEGLTFTNSDRVLIQK